MSFRPTDHRKVSHNMQDKRTEAKCQLRRYFEHVITNILVILIEKGKKKRKKDGRHPTTLPHSPTQALLLPSCCTAPLITQEKKEKKGT